MLTREEIENWHNPPCNGQTKRVLTLVRSFFNTDPDIAAVTRSSSNDPHPRATKALNAQTYGRSNNSGRRPFSE